MRNRPSEVYEPLFITEASLDVDEWIRLPSEGGQWSKHVKIAEEYALFYYSSKPTSSTPTPDAPNMPSLFVESVSDVLFVRLQNRNVVDVEDHDVIEVVRHLDRLF